MVHCIRIGEYSGKRRKDGRIDSSVKEYSDVDRNMAYKSLNEAGFEEGSYTLRADAQAFKDMPGFVNLPLEKIGRY